MTSNGTSRVVEPVYGLRTWSVVREGEAERLAGPQQGGTWPAEGAWFCATCSEVSEHRAPDRTCNCGVHAWHISKSGAKNILSTRREIPGIAETAGAVAVHEQGIRAERARPHALLLLPGRNGAQVRRLADAYDAQVVEVRDADGVLDYCRAHDLGLDESTVAELVGPAATAELRRAGRERRRAVALRLAAAVALAALLVVAGLTVLTDPPGERVLNGRTGEIRVNSR